MIDLFTNIYKSLR